MSTHIINTIDDIKNDKYKLYDQFIFINPGAKYDSYDLSVLTYKDHGILILENLCIKYNINRSCTSNSNFSQYVTLNGQNYKCMQSEHELSLQNQEFFNFLKHTDFINNKTGNIKLKDTSCNYTTIPFNDEHMVIMHINEFNSNLYNQRLLFGILTNNNKFVILTVKDDYDFLNFIYKNSPDRTDLTEFKNKILNICQYSIYDYLSNKDMTQFIDIVGDKFLEKFKPVFTNNKFNIYLDYFKNELLMTVNNKCTCCVSNGYKRIFEMLTEYYINNKDVINPLTGELKSNIFTKQYEDVDSLVIGMETDYGTTAEECYTKIFGVFVHSTTEEIKNIKLVRESIDALEGSTT